MILHSSYSYSGWIPYIEPRLGPLQFAGQPGAHVVFRRSARSGRAGQHPVRTVTGPSQRRGRAVCRYVFSNFLNLFVFNLFFANFWQTLRGSFSAVSTPHFSAFFEESHLLASKFRKFLPKIVKF